MSRSGSVEVRPRWNDRSESEQALTLRHSDEIRLGDRVGRINSVRLDFAALRAELLGGHMSKTATRESLRQNTRHFSTEWGRGWRQLPIYKYSVQDVGSAVSTATNDTRWPTVSRDRAAIHAMRALQGMHCMYGMRDQNASQSMRHTL